MSFDYIKKYNLKECLTYCNQNPDFFICQELDKYLKKMVQESEFPRSTIIGRSWHMSYYLGMIQKRIAPNVNNSDKIKKDLAMIELIAGKKLFNELYLIKQWEML